MKISDMNRAFRILARHLDLLTNAKYVYTQADLIGKSEFIKLVFDSNLYYFERIYRTPTMSETFCYNQLKMNEKSFFAYEKRGILSDSPLGGDKGSSIEPLVKILELIRSINEEKRNALDYVKQIGELIEEHEMG